MLFSNIFNNNKNNNKMPKEQQKKMEFNDQTYLLGGNLLFDRKIFSSVYKSLQKKKK